MVDIGAFGGNSDGGIFACCTFGKLFLQNQVGLPGPDSVGRRSIENAFSVLVYQDEEF